MVVVVVVVCFVTKFKDLKLHHSPTKDLNYSDCVIRLDQDISIKSPMMMDENFQFLMPDAASGNITMVPGQTVLFVCAGDGNYFTEERIPRSTQHVNGSCVSGKTFYISGFLILVYDLTCSRTPSSTPRKTGETCNGDYTAAEIGFNFGNTSVKLYSICFDEDKCRSVYSKHILTPEVANRQFKTSFAFRSTDGFLYESLPGRRPYNLYTCKTERDNLESVLGSAEKVTSYMNCSTTGSPTQLSRGHLTPNGDFIYPYQQNATYYHANAAPQWQFCNNRNWKSLEERCRNYARNNKIVLTIYTGTSGQNSYLLDDNNNKQVLFLLPGQKIPVPLYYFKIVYNPSKKFGIAFILYNVHYNQSPQFFEIPEYDSICKETGWFSDDEINFNKGIIQCLTISEFLSVTGFKDFKDEVLDTIKYY
ncbi:hypothetical protein ANN_21141 [Periplaneta americana]|uniref:DNA/RNA non-specific endonuclease domain-containing protein n=1 Tax=Periplaneta americana TaxID=6978 RepID=A0ABQ8SEI6_PERAM|nr:hypothetical protein ANN_21141 [Periplaneta americana]